LHRADELEYLAAVDRFADDTKSVLGSEQDPQPFAKEPLAIDEYDARHARPCG